MRPAGRAPRASAPPRRRRRACRRRGRRRRRSCRRRAPAARRLARHRARLADRVLERVVAQLLVARRDDVERDPQLLEDRAPLRRGRGEQEPHPTLARPPDLLRRASAAPSRASAAPRSDAASRPRAPGSRSGPRPRSRSRAGGGSSRRSRGGTRSRPRRATRSGACRSSRAAARGRAAPPRSWAQSMKSVPLTRKTSSPPGPQQPRRLRDPAVGVAPDRGAVLRDGEVEARVRQRHVLGARLDQRELEPELLLHRAGGLELGRRDVDADRPARRAARARRRCTPCRSRARPRPCRRRREGREAPTRARARRPSRTRAPTPGARSRRTRAPTPSRPRGCAARGRRGSRLPRLPDLLHRPAPRPREVVPVRRRRVLGRARLDQVLDHEPVPAEEPDPLAHRELEGDRAVRVLAAVEAEVVGPERRRRPGRPRRPSRSRRASS